MRGWTKAGTETKCTLRTAAMSVSDNKVTETDTTEADIVAFLRVQDPGVQRRIVQEAGIGMGPEDALKLRAFQAVADGVVACIDFRSEFGFGPGPVRGDYTIKVCGTTNRGR